MHWYIVESGQATGPHDRVAMERLVALGRITAGTKVCSVGDTAWTTAAQDPVIASLLAQLAGGASMTARADAVLGASHPPLATTPIPEEELPAFTYGGSSQLGHKAFKARWSALVLIGLIYLALSYALGVPGVIAEMLRAAAEQSGRSAPGTLALDVFGYLLSVFVGGPLLSGFVLAGARAARGAGQVADLFIGFQRYWNVVLAYFVSILLIGLIYLALSYALGVPGMIAEMLRAAAEQSGRSAPGTLALDVFGWLLSVFIGGPLLSGFVVAGARAARGAGQVADLFIGFQRYWNVVLAYFVSILLIGVAIVAAVIPGLVMFGLAVGFELNGNFGNIGFLGAFGVLLAALGALAVSILIMPRLVFMGALAADPSLPKEGLEATLRRSWSLTAGKAPAMFALLLVYGIVLGLSVVLLCVGMPLLGMPLFAAVQGAMYATVFSAGHPRRLGS